MEYKTILKKLEEDYGWSFTKEFSEMQKELVEDVAKIVSNQVEPPVSPMLAEEIKKARIKENLYWIEWLREVEVACPDREEYESRIEEIEKEE